MEQYDVVVIGGGIAGSVAARFAAEHGFKTLLIEKGKTPRNKPCSGIQFPYLEKLVGAKAPPDKLCENELYKVEIVSPSGKTLNGKMKMLNFWRSTFDSWLNDVAVDAGSDFQDGTRLVDFEQKNTGVRLQLQTGQQVREIQARYMIAADGMFSQIRKKLRPDDFLRKTAGGSMNYYCVGETSLDPNTLYMIYDRDFAPLMFAWAYLKDDLWSFGTGTVDEPPVPYADRFMAYIQDRYDFRGEIVRREGFASPLVGGVFLGEGNLLLTGDAAGLLDVHRGMGMDNAALSARYAVKAIVAAEKSKRPVSECYQGLMSGIARKVEANIKKQTTRYESNDTIEASLNPLAMLSGGLLMMGANWVNNFLPPEKVITLPL